MAGWGWNLLKEDLTRVTGEKKRRHFHQIKIVGDDGGKEMEQASKKLYEALCTRDKYQYILDSPLQRRQTVASNRRTSMMLSASVGQLPPTGLSQLAPTGPSQLAPTGLSQYERRVSVSAPGDGGNNFDYLCIPAPEGEVKYTWTKGIVHFTGQVLMPIPYDEHVSDLAFITKMVEDGPCKSTTRARLKILGNKFELHKILNEEKEGKASEERGGGDYYSTMKVDLNIRLTMIMNARELLRCVKEKVINDGDLLADPVQRLTLRDVFTRTGLEDPSLLTVESLGVTPGAQKQFHRFDPMSKYNSRKPSYELLPHFLRRTGASKGRYFAEVVKRVFARPKSHMCMEIKIPIFGGFPTEWEALAKWLQSNHFLSDHHVRWIIQIPRIAELRESEVYAQCETLQNQLDFLFNPMWEATLNPLKHPAVAQLLDRTTAINIICDEAKRGQDLPTRPKAPSEFPWKRNPPDQYFNYYVWANLLSLNAYRKSKGMNTIGFRPNAGEMGDHTSLVSAYLLADSVIQGTNIEQNTVLQYLFYLSQIGICISPLANNFLVKPYLESPFRTFFMKGLRVALCTDDPLHYHHTNEPLHEEYGTAQKLFKLTNTDLCEIAMNSVLISGFDYATKQRWLGRNYLYGPDFNNFSHTNVPTTRMLFRTDCLTTEKRIIVKMLMRYNKRMQYAADLANGINPPLGLTVSFFNSAGDTGEKVDYQRIEILGPGESKAREKPARHIQHALELRKKYIEPWKSHFPQESSQTDTCSSGGRTLDENYEAQIINGVVCLRRKEEDSREQTQEESTAEDEFVKTSFGSKAAYITPECVPYSDYERDLNTIYETIESVDVKTLAHNRLGLLEQKFRLHKDLNDMNERPHQVREKERMDMMTKEFGKDAMREDTTIPRGRVCEGGPPIDHESHRDFYESYKVDNNVFLSDFMTSRHLLRFLRDKYQSEPHGIVSMAARKAQEVGVSTLEQFIGEHSIDLDNLAVRDFQVNDELNESTQRNSMLHSLCLEYDNKSVKGRYFADLIKNVFDYMSRDKYVYTQARLVVYGKTKTEWKTLADWFTTHGLVSNCNRFTIAIPRCYNQIHQKFRISFEQQLSNLFLPLFNASINPSKNANLNNLLNHICGFDFVECENETDGVPTKDPPARWNKPLNPPYSYWLYYLYANVAALNAFRRKRGQSTFTLSAMAGQHDGTDEHLACAFLLCNTISYGIALRKNPALEYLYYLAQIGITISPLGTPHNEYLSNPVISYFSRGLLVSLSTNKPLLTHYTMEPLIEEYSICSVMWQLTPTDLCEIAKNSVLISGFPHETKQRWLGAFYHFNSPVSNNAPQTHVSNIRTSYRFETYHVEADHIDSCAGQVGPRFMNTEQYELEVWQSLAGKSHHVGFVPSVDPPDWSDKESQLIEVIRLQFEEIQALREASKVLRFSLSHNDESSDRRRLLGGSQGAGICQTQ